MLIARPGHKKVLDAIGEMVLQKGFLDICQTNEKIARKGVLVRHLILLGHAENSIHALTTLFLEFGRELPISLMSQYTPVHHLDDHALNRVLTEEEFNKVYSYAPDLGFENLFVQFPEQKTGHLTEISPFFSGIHQIKTF